MGGFRPIAHLTGGSGGCFKTSRYQKDGTTTGNFSEIFPGDPVILLGSGLIRGATSMSAASTPVQRAVLGVAARIVEDRQGKPKTFATSGKGLYSNSASTSDWIDVYVDPGIVYECLMEAGASAGQTEIGRLVQTTVVQASKVSAAGVSGTEIQASAPATANCGLFRIVDISPRSLTPTTDKGSSDGLVTVVIDSHVFGNFQGGTI